MPRSMRPGWSASSMPNCSATTSDGWFGSITPPEPTRMVVVAAAMCPIRTGGDELAMPGMPWCSATQNRVKPSRSARAASSVVARSASPAVPPSGMGARSSTESGAPFRVRGTCVPATPAKNTGRRRDLPERSPKVIDRSSRRNGVLAEFARMVGELEGMRIAIITESFPPDVNGVANCVVRVAENLVRKGHHPLVIAPESARSTAGADSHFRYPVERVPSVPLPGYSTFRLGLPTPRTRRAVACHRADVVHLASPVALGAWGSRVAKAMDLPVVAIYQTDLPNYARAYRLGAVTEAFAWRWLRDIHNAAARTLAPSSVTAADLHAHGMERVWLWGRGVDAERFNPARRDERLRAEIAPGGEVIVGYVGRLATEKRVDLLAAVAAIPGVRLAITGGGPMEEELRQAIPSAVFLGERHGADLARIYASLDVFVHTGPFETFGQTIQEAAASGLPVVAPAAGGPLDLVEDGVTGFLVPPGDGDAFAAAAGRLAADPALRSRFAAAARRRVLGRTWPALVDELIGHYAAVIGAETTPARMAA